MKAGRHLFFAGSGALFALFFLACLGGCTERRSEQYRQQGDTYLRIERLAEAESQYRRALEADSKNAMARLGLARTLLRAKRVEEAMQAYAEAADISPVLAQAYVEPAYFLLRAGNVPEAEALAQRLSAASLEEGGVLLAYIQRESGHAEKAVETLERLKEQFPKSMSVAVNLGAAYLAAGQPARTEEVIKEALQKIDANSLAARMTLVDAYQAQGKLPEIIAELEPVVEKQKAAVAANPSDEAAERVLSDTQLTLARSLLDSGRFAESETLARVVLAAHPDSGWANFIVGSCLLAAGSYGDALPYLQTAEHALPQQASVAQKIAQLRAHDKASANVPAGSEPTTSRPEILPPNTALALQRSWRELWSMANLERLAIERDRFLAKPEPNLLETISLAALFTGNKALALELAGRLPADSPFHAFYDALESRDFKALIGVFDQWKESDLERKVLRENAKGWALAMCGARMQAFAVYSQCLANFPNNSVPFRNLAYIYEAAGMPEYAMRCLEKLIALHPDGMEARRKLFELMIESGRFQEARVFAESTYTSFPNDKEALIDLASAYQKTLQPELAVEALSRGIQAYPGDSAFQLRLVMALAQVGNLNAAQELLDHIRMLPENKVSIAVMAGALRALRGEWQESAKALGVLTSEERDMSARMLYAAALLSTDRAEEARIELTAIPEEAPLARSALYAALVRSLRGDAAAGSDEADVLARSLSSAPAVRAQCAAAMAYTMLGLYGPAYASLDAVAREIDPTPALMGMLFDLVARGGAGSDILPQALALADRHADAVHAWLGLARICARLGNAEEEKKALDRAMQLAPDHAAALIQLSAYWERRGDIHEAGRIYRRLSELLPEDPAVANNLAYNMLQSGEDAKKALGLAQAAQSKLPSNPRVLHTLGLAQLRTGNLEEGRKNLTIALEQQPADPTILLDVGQLLIAEGKADEGKQFIRSSLQYASQLGLKFDRRAEAEALADGKRP